MKSYIDNVEDKLLVYRSSRLFSLKNTFKNLSNDIDKDTDSLNDMKKLFKQIVINKRVSKFSANKVNEIKQLNKIRFDLFKMKYQLLTKSAQLKFYTIKHLLIINYHEKAYRKQLILSEIKKISFIIKNCESFYSNRVKRLNRYKSNRIEHLKEVNTDYQKVIEIKSKLQELQKEFNLKTDIKISNRKNYMKQILNDCLAM